VLRWNSVLVWIQCNISWWTASYVNCVYALFLCTACMLLCLADQIWMPQLWHYTAVVSKSEVIPLVNLLRWCIGSDEICMQYTRRLCIAFCYNIRTQCSNHQAAVYGLIKHSLSSHITCSVLMTNHFRSNVPSDCGISCTLARCCCTPYKVINVWVA